MQLTDGGEPIYGDRDVPDLAAIRSLGLPFWLAGSRAEPERLTEALAAGMDKDMEGYTGLTFPGYFALVANRHMY